jgi:hypothetical protein
MKRWYRHRTRVLLLAVLLGLGMSLSFVQGSMMAAGMVVAPAGAHDGSSGCNGCGGGNHNDMSAGTCLTVCAFAAQGLMPGELTTVPSASRAGFQVAQLLLSGQSHHPDHGPPKILTLG